MKKVLCVDDERINLLILEKLLGKNFEVLTADSGDSGLKVLEQNPSISFVISDMKMPGMNGLQFIAKAKEKWRDKVYFILSGYSLSEEIQEALDKGLILAYFEKPADLQKIQKALMENS